MWMITDNPPRFAHHQFDVYIAENSPLGSIVDRIVAIDPDTGSNADIKYRISGGDDMNSFELIQPLDDGQVGRDLRTRIQLDYEYKSEYRYVLVFYSFYVYYS
jgi:hypothetical protein